MAGNDPTKGRKTVGIEVSVRDRKFLREIFTMARDGVREELAEQPDRLRRPTRLRREEAAYERLLAGLRDGRLEVDRDVRAVLAELAEIVDASNEYSRVVTEHEALHGLIASL
jgi:hypothetical protein